MSPTTSIPLVRVPVAIGVTSFRLRPLPGAAAVRPQCWPCDEKATQPPRPVGGQLDEGPMSDRNFRPTDAVRRSGAMSTIGDQLVQVLRQAGVARVYGVVGDSLNPFVDAIRRTEGIEWIHVRNEEAGAFAAAAEAHLTGRLAVCAGSCGPGNTHLIQGLYAAERRAGPGDRLAHPDRADRHVVLPGNPSRAALRRMQPLLRAGQPGLADAATRPDRDPAGDRTRRRRGAGDPRRLVASRRRAP